MADIKAFLFTIGGVILAAIVLKHFGYLSHTSPLKMTAGAGTAGIKLPAKTSIPATPPMRSLRYEI